MKDDRRLKRKVRNSYIVSTVSVALVLFLLGSVGYLMAAAMTVARTLQQSITVTAELRPGLDEERKEAIRATIAGEELVREITYSPKEEKIADEDFRRMFKAEIEEILGDNPLRDSYEITLSARSGERELLEGFIARVEAADGIDRVSYPAQMIERLHATVRKIRLVLTLFGGALLIISLILLNNPIRLAIFSKRYQINTMKMVYHAPLPGKRGHTRPARRNRRVGTLLHGGLRTQRSDPRTHLAGRGGQGGHHRRIDGRGRHPAFARLHFRGGQ